MMTGRGVSQGLGMGKVVKITRPEIHIPDEACTDEAACLKQFDDALAASKDDLKAIQAKAKGTLDKEHLAIFDAHLQMVDDIEIVKQVKEKISESMNPLKAYKTVTDTFKAMFEAMDDPYFKERASDIADIQTRVLSHMAGTPLQDLALLDTDTIIVADDLTPSDTAALDLSKVQGFATEIGGYTSHTAIMARAIGLPAVVGISGVMDIEDGALALIDGTAGKLDVNPSDDALSAFQKALKDAKALKAKLDPFQSLKGLTKDGHSIPLYANIGSAKDLPVALKNGAEGIGLFRTEFLFMESSEAPSLETQIQAYSDVFKAIHPVIVRTLDIGGDKALPYLKQPTEDNPFLGVRAIRLCFNELELFKTQLKALLIASAPYPDVRIMFPMIARLDEVQKAKAILDEVKAELNTEQTPYQTVIKIGIMIEIPAAALNARTLAKHVDFFSIGTNDLIQYTYAADRMNDGVSYLYEPLDPTLLRLIQSTVEAAHAENTEIGVCGEMASDVKAALLLSGMGMDELSMSGPALLEVKEALTHYTMDDLIALKDKALAFDTADQVRALFNP